MSTRATTQRGSANDDEPPSDALERRRWQNRMSQRNHRQKLRERIAQLEDRLSAQELRSQTLWRTTRNSNYEDAADIDFNPAVHALPNPTESEPTADGRPLDDLCPVCNGSGQILNISLSNQGSTEMLPQTTTASQSFGMSTNLPLSEALDGSFFDPVNADRWVVTPAASDDSISPNIGKLFDYLDDQNSRSSQILDDLIDLPDAVSQPHHSSEEPPAGRPRPVILLISPDANTNDSRLRGLTIPTVTPISQGLTSATNNSQHVMYLIHM